MCILLRYLERAKRYNIEDRGEIEVKGKGLMNTYFLNPSEEEDEEEDEPADSKAPATNEIKNGTSDKTNGANGTAVSPSEVCNIL